MIIRSRHIAQSLSALLNALLLEMLRELILFQLIKVKPLVGALKWTYSSQNKSKWTKVVANHFIERTIFKQFCSGKNIMESILTANEWHKRFRISSIMDHCSEELEGEEAFDQNFMAKMRMIEICATGNGPVNFVPLKCTSFFNGNVLALLSDEKYSRFDDITSLLQSLNDASLREQVKHGFRRLEAICNHAKRHKISLLLDAEQSDRQPAIELIFRMLVVTANSDRAVLYNTYQAYLKRTEKYLKKDLDFCEAKGTVFAAKLVRGAYIQSERQRGNHHVILQDSKEMTDRNYDQLSSFLIDRIASDPSKASVMFATHNRSSIEKVISNMREKRLPLNHSGVHFAQILGMCDELTKNIASSGCNAHKLLLFGELDQLIPWLLRRLDENQDGFGAVQQEQKLLINKLKHKLMM